MPERQWVNLSSNEYIRERSRYGLEQLLIPLALALATPTPPPPPPPPLLAQLLLHNANKSRNT